eukprot:3993594-Pyramimonas_sp.AAC.1
MLAELNCTRELQGRGSTEPSSSFAILISQQHSQRMITLNIQQTFFVQDALPLGSQRAACSPRL